MPVMGQEFDLCILGRDLDPPDLGGAIRTILPLNFSAYLRAQFKRVHAATFDPIQSLHTRAV